MYILFRPRLRIVHFAANCKGEAYIVPVVSAMKATLNAPGTSRKGTSELKGKVLRTQDGQCPGNAAAPRKGSHQGQEAEADDGDR